MSTNMNIQFNGHRASVHKNHTPKMGEFNIFQIALNVIVL